MGRWVPEMAADPFCVLIRQRSVLNFVNLTCPYQHLLIGQYRESSSVDALAVVPPPPILPVLR